MADGNRARRFPVEHGANFTTEILVGRRRRTTIQQNLNYRDDAGAWCKTKIALSEETDTLAARETSVPVEFPKSVRSPVVVSNERARVSLTPLGARHESSASARGSSCALYESAWTGVDISRRVIASGFKEDFTLRSGHPVDLAFRVESVERPIEHMPDGSLKAGNLRVHAPFFTSNISDPTVTTAWVPDEDNHHTGVYTVTVPSLNTPYPAVLDPSVTVETSFDETILSASSIPGSNFSSLRNLSRATELIHGPQDSSITDRWLGFRGLDAVGDTSRNNRWPISVFLGDTGVPIKDRIEGARVVFSLVTTRDGFGSTLSAASKDLLLYGHQPESMSTVSLADYGFANHWTALPYSDDSFNFATLPTNPAGSDITFELNDLAVSFVRFFFSSQITLSFGPLFRIDGENSNVSFAPIGSRDLFAVFNTSSTATPTRLIIDHVAPQIGGTRRLIGPVLGTSAGSVFLHDEWWGSDTTLDVGSTVTSRWRSGLIPSRPDPQVYSLLNEAWVEYQSDHDGTLSIYATNDFGESFTRSADVSLSASSEGRTAHAPLTPISGKHLQIEVRSTDGSRPRIGRIQLRLTQQTGRYS